MNEQEKALWIEIYTQTFERTHGNQASANRCADQAVSEFRKSQERFHAEEPVR